MYFDSQILPLFSLQIYIYFNWPSNFSSLVHIQKTHKDTQGDLFAVKMNIKPLIFNSSWAIL